MTYHRNLRKKWLKIVALICCALFVWHIVSGLDLFHRDSLGDSAALNGRGVPLLMQTDVRWANKNYGDGTISESGCGPTCLAMVVRGLIGGSVTPDEVAAFSEENGYFNAASGTSWSLMTEGASSFGISGQEIPLDQGTILNALNQGKPIIASVRPGDFTEKGHFIVLVAVADNGEIIVNDPNSEERSRKTWPVERLMPQIKNLWSYTSIP